jgi:hypothetical protein
VRELEARARQADADRPEPRQRRHAPAGSLHPDQEAAIERILDTLGPALGREIEVAPGKRGGYRVQMSFESLDEALELARRL